MTEKTQEALETFYHGQVPGYIKDAGKTYLIIQVRDWEGTETLKITLTDVIVYYHTQARNIVSGMRSLAGHYGDWRHIDNLAQEALEWFKFVNRPALEREGSKRGMTLLP